MSTSSPKEEPSSAHSASVHQTTSKVETIAEPMPGTSSQAHSHSGIPVPQLKHVPYQTMSIPQKSASNLPKTSPKPYYSQTQTLLHPNHQYYSLRWNNYQSNLTSVFHELLESQSFVDVTLACQENSLKAHKVVLSACSSFFQKLLLDNPCKHPTIIMPPDINFADLQFIIEFVYRGEIDVSEAELQAFTSF